MNKPFNLFAPPLRACDCEPCDEFLHSECVDPCQPAPMDTVPEEGSENGITSGAVWQAVQDALAQIGLIIGDLADLSTDDKSNIVAAINELFQRYITLDNRTKQYSFILGAPIIVSPTGLTLAGDTRTWTVTAGGATVAGQYGTGRTTYTFAAPNPDLITVLDASGAVAYQWNKPPLPAISYESLTNLPQINGVTLSGNRSAADLSLATSQEVAAKYTKPAAGIPLGDLAMPVQDRLVPTGGTVDAVLTQEADGTPAWKSWVIQPDVQIMDSPGVHLNGNGQAANPLQAVLTVSPDAGNIVQLLTNGVFVPRLEWGDTATVDLGLSGQQVTANVKLSSMAGNQIQIDTNGLYVAPFSASAIDVVDSATVGLTGNGFPATPVKADLKLATDADNALEVKATGLYAPPPIASVFTSSSTATVTGAGSSASPFAVGVKVSTAQGNLLTIDGTGLVVNDPGGLTSVTTADSATVDFQGAGTTATPLTANILISSTQGNQLSIDGTGLLVPAAGEASVQVLSSSSVNMTGTGTAANKIQASVNLSSDAGNAIESRAGGLYVPTTLVNVVSEESTTTTTQGVGTTASPLKVNVKINTDSDNALVNTTTGLKVPSTDVAVAVADTTSIDLAGNGSTTATALTATLKLSADAGQIATVRTDGLYVPAANSLSTGNTGSVTLGGAGTSSSPLTATLTPSTNTGNALTLDSNGAPYVATVTPGISDAPSDTKAYVRKDGAWVDGDGRFVRQAVDSSDTFLFYTRKMGVETVTVASDTLVNSTAVWRNAQGRAQIATPSADSDIANKSYVDAAQTAAQSFATSAVATHNSATDSHSDIRQAVSAAANSGLPWTNAYWYALASGSAQPPARDGSGTAYAGQNYIDLTTNPPSVYTVNVTSSSWTLTGTDDVAQGRPVIITKKIWGVSETENAGGKLYRTGSTTWIVSPDLTAGLTPDNDTIVRRTSDGALQVSDGITGALSRYKPLTTATTAQDIQPNDYFVYTGTDTLLTLDITALINAVAAGAEPKTMRFTIRNLSAADGDISVSADGADIQIQSAGHIYQITSQGGASGNVSTARLNAGAEADIVITAPSVSGVKLVIVSPSTFQLLDTVGWVTNDYIGNEAVTNDKLASLSVTSAKLALNAVTSAQLAGSAVLSSKIADNAVTNAKIASSAVMTNQLANAAVTTAKVADRAITGAQVGNNFVLTGTVPTSETEYAVRNIGMTTADFTPGLTTMDAGAVILVYEV